MNTNLVENKTLFSDILCKKLPQREISLLGHAGSQGGIDILLLKYCQRQKELFSLFYKCK